MLRQSLGQEVAYADPARRIYHNPWILCELVLAADLEACKDLVDRGNPFSRRTNGDRGIARDGVEHGKTFRELPSCFESCEVVQLGSESNSVGTVDPDLCDPWSSDLGPRRHDGSEYRTTFERRRGSRIKAKGIYRDPVRSSHGHFVKASGLRWLSLMLLTPIPWAGRTWALPFLTVLAPSERYYQSKARKHKKLTEWALQVVLQARR